MKCKICKAEYNESLPNCPFCGAVNPNVSASSPQESPKENCYHCGKPAELGDRFCGDCGVSLENIRHCIRCNAIIKPDDVFCTQCGFKSENNTYEAKYTPKQHTASSPESAMGIYGSPNEEYVRPHVTAEILDDSSRIPDYHSTTHQVVSSPVNEPVPPSAPHQPEQATLPIVIAPVVTVQDDRSPAPAAPYVPPVEPSLPPAPAIQRPPMVTQTTPAQMPLVTPEPVIIPTVSSTPFKEDTKNKKKKKRSKAPLIILLILFIALLVGALLVYFDVIVLPNSITKYFSKTQQTLEVTPAAKPEKNVTEDGGDSTIVEPDEGSGDSVTATSDSSVDKSHTTKPLNEKTWSEVTGFDENGLARVKDGELWGIISLNGDYVVEPEYTAISDFSDGFASVSKDDKFGYINNMNELFVPIEYTSASDFSEGFGIVTNADGSNFVDANGKLTPISIEGQLSPVKNGFSAVNTESGGFFISTEGKVAFEDTLKFDQVSSFSDGIAAVKKGDKWGYIDFSGNMVVDYIYDKAESFEGGFAVVVDGKNSFLIDSLGNRVTPMVDEIWSPQDGISTAKKDNLYGFVPPGNAENMLIEPQYKDAYSFSMGVAPVSKNEGNWYYVDIANNAVFGDKVFDEAYRFVDSLACVKDGAKYTIIGLNGEVAVDETWEQVGDFAHGVLPVYNGGSWSFVSVSANV